MVKEPDAVALLTRLAGAFGDQRTNSEVDGDSTGCGWPVCWSVRMNTREGAPATWQGRKLQDAAPESFQ